MAVPKKRNGAVPKKEIVDTKQRRDGTRFLTYQLELVRCNKPGCHRLHGPYWYAYWKRGGRTRKRYIGRVWRELTHEQLRATERSEERKLERARKSLQRGVA